MASSTYTSVLHALRVHASSPPVSDGRRGFVLSRGKDVTETGYAALLEAVERAAANVSSRGVRPGDRVVVSLPTGAPFLIAFLGSVALGAIPTEATTTGMGSGGATAGHLDRLIAYLRPTAIILPSASAEMHQFPQEGIAVIDGDNLYRRATDPTSQSVSAIEPEASSPAFIQCTSGSTGQPKGVVITRENRLTNCVQIAQVAGWTARDTFVSWLPLHHDMGLIAEVFCPILTGGTSVLTPSTRFLRYPFEWMRLVHNYTGTITAVSNFAFSYAAIRIQDHELDGIDLSSWRRMFCGAETIDPATIENFVDRFSHWGLPRNAVVPWYGMAEATQAVTVAENGHPIRSDWSTAPKRR